MYFSRVYKQYLPAIAELEKKSYPDELTVGLEEFEREYEENGLFRCSIAGFRKGELVCYVTAYEIDRENPDFRTFYISDVNCPNPIYLERLLIRFFIGVCSWYSGNKETRYTADMRSTSYRLLNSSKKRDWRGIRLLEDDDIPNFYSNGESAHRVVFSVDLDKYLEHTWKARFFMQLDQTELYRSDILSNCVEWLEDAGRQGVDFHDRKNMDFVLKHVEEKLLDYFQMFGARIPLAVEYALYSRDGEEERFEKTVAAYQSYGYKEGKGERSYQYYDGRKLLAIRQELEAHNTDFPGTLSGYRWLVQKETRFCGKIKSSHHGACYFDYYNKYGVRHDMVRVPYLNEKMYLYYLNRMLCICTQTDRMDGLDKQEEVCFRDLCKSIYYLLNSNDAPICIEKIVDRWNEDAMNYFHDWCLVIDTVVNAKSILTQGARKSILMKPYNQALKIERQLKAVIKMCPKKAGERYVQLKEIRKKVSSLLRKNQDCTEYIREINRYVLKMNRKKLQIPVADEPKAADYIARVQMYSPWVTILDLHRYFGMETLSRFIRGTYPCLFIPQEIQPSYAGLSEFVRAFLKTRTVQAKHVYRSIVKKELLPVIQSGELEKKQYEDTLEILKFHNVKVSDRMLMKLQDFKIQVEAKGSPEFLTAGDATVCCMGCGSQKAIDYATEEGFGILNVYYKDRVIANSVLWIHEILECLVLDNIEVHPNYMIPESVNLT